jgi:sigma-B regulation protein RsbU (phosphoserine phosphatase)
LGYACFIHFSVTEGRRYFQMHTEMALATEIHQVLVPAINSTLGNFEFYGRSLPSGEVGGDLIDVFHNERGWIAYIADVSGHGVAPGVVMGMVKSAARMQLSSQESSSQLLERLNSVLQPIKKPEMFATFAYLAWNGERLEYSSAGHPAILHYRAATQEIAELACPNVPLGLLEEPRFVSQSVECAPDDLFVLVTDGLLETTNFRNEEFGLDGVKSVLTAHDHHPASTVFDALLAAAHRHGESADDLSLLLVRCK